VLSNGWLDELRRRQPDDLHILVVKQLTVLLSLQQLLRQLLVTRNALERRQVLNPIPADPFSNQGLLIVLENSSELGADLDILFRRQADVKLLVLIVPRRFLLVEVFIWDIDVKVCVVFADVLLPLLIPSIILWIFALLQVRRVCLLFYQLLCALVLGGVLSGDRRLVIVSVLHVQNIHLVFGSKRLGLTVDLNQMSAWRGIVS